MDIRKNLRNDLKTFDKLPVKTRESLFLGNKSAKVTGKDRAVVDDKIKSKTDQA